MMLRPPSWLFPTCTRNESFRMSVSSCSLRVLSRKAFFPRWGGVYWWPVRIVRLRDQDSDLNHLPDLMRDSEFQERAFDHAEQFPSAVTGTLGLHWLPEQPRPCFRLWSRHQRKALVDHGGFGDGESGCPMSPADRRRSARRARVMVLLRVLWMIRGRLFEWFLGRLQRGSMRWQILHQAARIHGFLHLVSGLEEAACTGDVNSCQDRLETWLGLPLAAMRSIGPRCAASEPKNFAQGAYEF